MTNLIHFLSFGVTICNILNTLCVRPKLHLCRSGLVGMINQRIVLYHFLKTKLHVQ